jgi:RNHCP domain-containing protein
VISQGPSLKGGATLIHPDFIGTSFKQTPQFQPSASTSLIKLLTLGILSPNHLLSKSMPKHFIKVKEDFTCDHCGYKVTGTGFTNHCPKCLYSKHVDDLVPGDRKSSCLSLMKPIASTLKNDQFTLIHQCLNCQKITKNKAFKNDNQELLSKLSSMPTPIK